MADVHFRVPYGLMSPHRYPLVFLSLRAREFTGAISWNSVKKSGCDHNIEQAERHSELPRPNGWCPFSGTLWTHESTQVLWCSWVLGQGSTHRAIPWNSGQDRSQYWATNAIVNCRVPMADVQFSGTLWIKPTSWCNAISRKSPLCLPCPKTQEHQSTCVDSQWVHRVPYGKWTSAIGFRGNSLWRSVPKIPLKRSGLITIFKQAERHSELPRPNVLMSIFGYPMDSWVTHKYLCGLLSLRA